MTPPADLRKKVGLLGRQAGHLWPQKKQARGQRPSSSALSGQPLPRGTGCPPELCVLPVKAAPAYAPMREEPSCGPADGLCVSPSHGRSESQEAGHRTCGCTVGTRERKPGHGGPEQNQ